MEVSREIAGARAGWSFHLRRLFQYAAPTALGLKDLAVKWSRPERIPELAGAWATMVWLDDGQKRDQKRAAGFAIDCRPRLLAVKALMEACEAMAIKDAGDALESRTGVAAHVSLDQAKHSAYLELIERDAFLYHWLTERTAPRALHARDFWRNAAACHLVELLSADDAVSVVMAGSRLGEYGCWNLGLGAATSRKTAARKALQEWAGGVFRHRLARSCPGSGADGAADPIARQHLHSKNPRVSALLEYLLAARGEDGSRATQGAPKESGPLAPENTLVFRRLPTRSKRYSVVQSSSAMLLPLHFGENFKNQRETYLCNPRVAAALSAGEKPRFHPEGEFLPHPFD